MGHYPNPGVEGWGLYPCLDWTALCLQLEGILPPHLPPVISCFWETIFLLSPVVPVHPATAGGESSLQQQIKGQLGLGGVSACLVF